MCDLLRNYIELYPQLAPQLVRQLCEVLGKHYAGMFPADWAQQPPNRFVDYLSEVPTQLVGGVVKEAISAVVGDSSML